MPYTITKQDGKFVVHKRGETHALGKHDTKQEAQDQIAALNASENASKAKKPRECKSCKASVQPDSDGMCPTCGADMEDNDEDDATGQEAPKESKKMNLSYAKSISVLSEDELRKTIAAKFIGPDKIFHYAFLWGHPEKHDLDLEFFTKSTDFWDATLGKSPRPLTWDHAQDESMKASPIIGKTVEFGDDDIGRWAISHLERAHMYRKAIDKLIEEGVIGTSSDTAPQYAVREPRGKSAWLKVWPWFASALTDVPCEPRMIGTVEYFKSLGLDIPDPEASVSQTREMVKRAQRIFNYIDVFGR